jgi:hypothetical protein
MRISILTPSRGRPEGLYRLFKSMNETVTCKVDLVIGIDMDDPKKPEYENLLIRMRQESVKNLRVVMIADERKPLCAIWNYLLRLTQGDWIMCGNDDFIFQTKGWDKILEEKTKGKHPYFMYYFDDGIQGANHGAFPILSKEWIETVGYYFPEIFIHNYPDTWVNDIALKLGVRIYIPEVKTKHLHYSEGLSEYDQTYQDGMKDNSNEKDKALFIQTEPERIGLTSLLKDKIKLWDQDCLH